jgi:RimJ/RimL family protein N-acetyltransferase
VSLNARDLLRQHLKLECIGFNSNGQLHRIDGPEPDDIPQFYVVQYPDNNTERFYREDVSEKVLHQLNKVLDIGAFMEPRTVRGILRMDQPVEHIHFGKSYIFPESFSVADESIQLIEHEGRPTHALMVDGQVVAFCQSSREDDRSAEAWVFTEPAHRGKGYAKRVTTAWAADALKRGKTAFYSHVIDNKPSEALAKSLGLIQYILDIGYF